jgi:hypothetical protein
MAALAIVALGAEADGTIYSTVPDFSFGPPGIMKDWNHTNFANPASGPDAHL